MKSKARIILNYLLLTGLCVIATSVLLIIEHSAYNNDQRINLTAGWTLEHQGEVEYDIIPQRKSYSSFSRGETFTIKTTLPETDIQLPMLCFYSKYCMVTAESGGTVIYEAGRKEYETGSLSGCWINQIPLSFVSPERDITITYTALETNVVLSLPEHYIITATDVYSDILRREKFSFCVSVFLIFVGLLGSVIGFTSLILKKKIYPLIAISGFSFWTGLLMFSTNGYMLLISHNYVLSTWLTYLSVYITPTALIAVFYYQIAKTPQGKRIAVMLGVPFGLLPIVGTILQLTTRFHLMCLMPVFNVLVYVAIIIAIIGRIRRFKVDRTKTDIVNIGFIVFILYCLTDWLRSFLFRLGVYQLGITNSTYIGIGIIVFVVSSLLTYITWLADFTRSQAEQETWSRVIERDVTTGLPSKTKSMQLLQQLHADETEYAVAIFNIDNYESVFAQGGDAAIEQLLERYAKLVKKVFGSYGMCGRMGKTRFIVAAPEMPEAKMRELVYVFSKYINRENSHNATFPIETSLGLAYSRECENKDPLAICQMAEEHMASILQLTSGTDEKQLLIGSEGPEKSEK